MADEVKRLRYFTGEFLQEQDFVDEQAYHRRLRYLHNRWLHTWGIAFGLDVTAGPGAKQVTVAPGMAIVKAVEGGEELGKEVVLTTAQVIDLPGGANDFVYIAIGFGETGAQPDSQGRNMRWIERANLRAFPPLTAPDNQADLILAVVTLNATGTGIQAIDLSERRLAGMRGDIEATNVSFPIPGELPVNWPRVRGLATPNRLEVTSPRLDLSGDLRLIGGNIVLGAGSLVDGRNVSADGAKLDAHDHSGGINGVQIDHANLLNAGSASGHVTGGDSHDHMGGDGAPIPWSALTAIPDILVEAYAVVNIVGVNVNILRSFGLVSVVRTVAGTYTVTWATSVTNPVVIINLRYPNDFLFCQMENPSSTQVIFEVRRADNTLVDPAGFMLVII